MYNPKVAVTQIDIPTGCNAEPPKSQPADIFLRHTLYRFVLTKQADCQIGALQAAASAGSLVGSSIFRTWVFLWISPGTVSLFFG